MYELPLGGVRDRKKCGDFLEWVFLSRVFPHTKDVWVQNLGTIALKHVILLFSLTSIRHVDKNTRQLLNEGKFINYFIWLTIIKSSQNANTFTQVVNNVAKITYVQQIVLHLSFLCTKSFFSFHIKGGILFKSINLNIYSLLPTVLYTSDRVMCRWRDCTRTFIFSYAWERGHMTHVITSVIFQQKQSQKSLREWNPPPRLISPPPYHRTIDNSFHEQIICQYSATFQALGP